jgi:micrococcal nuclease
MHYYYKNLLHLLLPVFFVTLTSCDYGNDQLPNSVEQRNGDFHASLPSSDQATIISGKVIAVLDGDTIDILDSHREKIRIRIHGIDAPEIGQPFGRNAKDLLAERIAGQQVNVVCLSHDRFGRTIGDIIWNGDRLSVQLVTEGMAWHQVSFAPNDLELATAELKARTDEVGLWSDKRHVPPWEWRKLSKEERDKLR